MSALSRISMILVIIGALNWLLVGLFQWDLISAIFGGDAIHESSGFSRVIYAIVGLAGIYSIKFLFDTRTPADADM
ncbi:hypothetical protein SAMN05444487_101265 [Marininema mesophilum]|uniref:DUF378 domain-containing protein n=1 Tax=Marininema mesophilum TaxID=1048340 RepID=A0A1H2QNA9_9BACL|nr:DUF378 domain-containing protein [Marininema mesophilum]SDW08611.1 hypothetical protein SAMN05444487_101265 [Marininema mesophilum]